MNTIDIICLVIIVFFTLLGLWHGFLRGIFRLLAWAAAIAGAYFANDLLAETISETLQTSSFSTTLVCICIGFLIPFLTLLFVSHMVNRAISGTVAGKADRILGAVFGIIKAILICFVLLTIMHILPFGGVVEETRDDAASYAAYKGCLETLGYPTEPLDLVGVAERKATEFTKNMANKASEKASEAVEEASEKAAEVAKDVVKDAVDEAVSKASEKADSAVKEAISKTSEKAAAAVDSIKKSSK